MHRTVNRMAVDDGRKIDGRGSLSRLCRSSHVIALPLPGMVEATKIFALLSSEKLKLVQRMRGGFQCT